VTRAAPGLRSERMPSRLLSVVVLNYRRDDLTDACLRSLARAVARVDGDVELLVVDNGSGDGSAERLRARWPDVRLEALPRNLGFAGGVERALEMTSGEWVALVNNDAEVEADALALMLAAGSQSADVGAVAPQIRFYAAPGLVNSAGLAIDALGVAYERLAGTAIDDPEVSVGGDIFGATGCVALYRRAMLDAVGGFDASFFAYLEDADLAWRARMASWRSVYEPRAVARHHASATAGEGSPRKFFLVGRNRVRLLAKNATRGQLLRWVALMTVFDAAYVARVAVTARTLAPLRGRLAGLREWRAYRRAGAAARRPVALAGLSGPRGALRMQAAYRAGGASSEPRPDLEAERAGQPVSHREGP
jgi:GT2 family glycosyltransferase